MALLAAAAVARLPKGQKPTVIDIGRFDIVELLRMFVNRFSCSLVEAGDWQGQSSMRLAIIEICMQALKRRPMV